MDGANGFRELSDMALHTTFAENHRPRAERVEQLTLIEDGLDRLINRTLETRGRLDGPALHGFAVLCCMPSIQAAATGERQSAETAQIVSGSMQHMAELVIDQQVITQETGRRTKGVLSEVGILSTLWWGIANGELPGNSYALPASKAQDQSTPGIRDGVDIIMRQTGKRHSGRHLIQAKTSRLRPRPLDNYLPGIAVITPADLTDIPEDSRIATTELFTALAKDDEPTLKHAMHNAKRLLRQARQDKIAARQAGRNPYKKSA